MNKKQISINIIAGALSGVITLLISLFLTPYLVNALGDAAYGYIGLSSSFVAFAGIFTTAIYSMANRFIVIAYEKNDIKKVNEYYSTLVVSGIVLAIIVVIAGMIMAININKIFNVSEELISYVQITFAISVLNFAIITLGTVFTTSTFLKNRLELSAVYDIAANIVKAIFLVSVFVLLVPKIYFVPLGGILYTCILYYGHFRNTKKLLPEISIKRKLVKLSVLKELIVSGSWNSLNSIMLLLMSGMDLVLANLLLGGKATGIISISATLIIGSNLIITAVVNAFRPSLTKTFAEGDLQKLHNQVKISSKLQCAVAIVPIVGLCVFSYKFYALWMPFKEANDLMLLSVITIIRVIDQFASLAVESIAYNFVLFNKLKLNVIIKLIIGITNIPLVVAIVRMSNNYNFNIVVIACLSSIAMIIYFCVGVPFLVRKATKQSLKQYYKIILQAVCMFVSVFVPFYFINKYTVCNSWVSFIAIVCIAGLLGYIIVLFVVASRQERHELYNKIKVLLRRKNNG